MHLILTSVSLISVIAVRLAQSDDRLCAKPPDISHATIVDAADKLREEHEIGKEIVYACQFGYVSTGKSRTLTCQNYRGQAEWTEPQFSCAPQSCGDPGYINNGHRVGSLFTFPNSVTYQCDVGYNLRGIGTRYCQTNGIWSNKIPTCEVVTCGPPKDIANGKVTAPSYEYGSELTYTCDIGFQLSRNEASYCTEDGTWSKTDVTCEEILCEMPEKPEFGSMTFTGGEGRPRAGSIVVFTCDEGRIASGPKTSKCLDIGKWTFPTPKCLEPCLIEYIENGEIGKYESKGYYRRYTEFKAVNVGTRVEEDEDLILRCSERYEAGGSEKREMTVRCRDGKWSAQLKCTLAPCRSTVPSAKNANAVRVNREHGGTVYYECFPDYKKVFHGSVTCNYGAWKGEPATCRTTKCSVNSISYDGIVKKSKLYYSDGEVFYYTCESPRYQLPVGHSGQIKCVDGTWTGDAPYCTAANCSTLPPQIEHGSIKDLSMNHGTVVKYVCEEPYILVGADSLVQCSHGEWKGQPPRCSDSSCYLNDLKNLAHVSTETQSITFSGDKLNVVCDDGYSARDLLPFCQNGKWNPNYQSPCTESGCEVPPVADGSFKIRILGKWVFHYGIMGYRRRETFREIPVGNVVPHGDYRLLDCDNHYSVHGGSNGRVLIECSKGKWALDPVCLIRGQKYYPTTAVPRLRPTSGRHIPTSTIETKYVFSSPNPSSTFLELTSPISSESKTTVAILTNPTTETPVNECFCTYPLNRTQVVAHADGKKLKFGSKVQNGSTIVLRCLHVGFHHFNGQREVTCECQPWHSDDFPSCTEPVTGNAVIILDKEVDVLIDGTIEIKKGQNIKFVCIAMESAEYPMWNVPSTRGVSEKNETKDRKDHGDILYETHLYIQNATYINEGTYECFLKNNSKTEINVTVIDPYLRCPEIPEDGGLIVKYNGNRHERSKAYFSCSHKNQELVGNAVSTCLRTKEWSNPSPHCTGIRCKKLKDTNLLTIQYTNHREVGSSAVFHCFAPVHVGVYATTCLENGLWADPTPSCTDECKVLEETGLLKIHYTDNRKINSTATFHCSAPGRRSGVPATKCLQTGLWADPTPTCTIPSCSGDDLLSSLPENTQPTMNVEKKNSFVYNSTVKLTCTEGIAEGNPVAKCGKDGKWNSDKVECLSGCRPLKKPIDSKLRLSPEEKEYKYGARITFSCPPGMKLDSNFQLIVCLNDGWSEKTIPNCIEQENQDYHSTSKRADSEQNE